MNEADAKTSSDEREANRPVMRLPQRPPGIPANARPMLVKGKVAWVGPNPGFDWNPLLDLPKNRPCPCRSGAKFKQCCLHKLPKVVPVKVAEGFREQMAKPDLVFLTKENEQQILGDAAAKAEEVKTDETSAQAPQDQMDAVSVPQSGAPTDAEHGIDSDQNAVRS